MRKLFTALIMGMCCITMHAQSFGFNGNGFFENRTPATDAAVAAYPGQIVLFIPGGPISKLADPVATPKGWGLSDERTAAFYASGGTDEDGASMQKWLDKEDAQPAFDYLQSCIDLSAAYPGEYAYIWRVNLNIDPDHTLQILHTLINGGCTVKGIILGSEVYSWLNFDFDAYKALFEPISLQIAEAFPTLPQALCVAPNPDRADHTRWNTAIADYYATAAARDRNFSAIDTHMYIGERNCPDTWNTMPAKRVITGSVDPELSTYFDQAYNCLLATTGIADRLATFKAMFPGISIWCAEGYTTNPSAYFGNTWLGAAAQFKFMVESTCDITGKQTCLSPDIYGDQCRRNDFDLPTDGILKRTGYWSTTLALEAIAAGAVELPDQPLAGTYYFYTKSGFSSLFSAPAGYEIKQVTVRRLSGQYLYSSSGGTQYHAKGSAKSYEISGIVQDVFSNTIIVPANSFGWVEVTLEKISDPVCICDDRSASNYNQQGNCPAPCIYLPKPCNRSWWQIWKPKCNSTGTNNSIQSRKSN